MRKLKKYKKKLLRVIPLAKALAFRAHSFYKSLIKTQSMFSLSNLQLKCQNNRTSSTNYGRGHLLLIDRSIDRTDRLIDRLIGR